MRAVLQQTKDTLALVPFLTFAILLSTDPSRLLWDVITAFFFLGWLTDTCFTLVLCGLRQIYASTVKDALGASGLFFATLVAWHGGPTLVLRGVAFVFFVVAFTIDALTVLSARCGGFNAYAYDLRTQQVPFMRVPGEEHIVDIHLP